MGFLFALDTELNATLEAERVFDFNGTITIYCRAVNNLTLTLSNSQLFLIFKVLFPRLIIYDVFYFLLSWFDQAFILGALRLLIFFNIGLKGLIEALNTELMIALAQFLKFIACLITYGTRY